MQNSDSIEDKDLQSLLDSIKRDLSSYVEKRFTLIKLRTYEKTSVASSFLGYSLIIFLLSVSIFCLGVLALGFLLGEYLDSYAIGFSILIVIQIIALIICVLNAKRIRRSIVNLVVSIIKKTELDEE